MWRRLRWKRSLGRTSWLSATCNRSQLIHCFVLRTDYKNRFFFRVAHSIHSGCGRFPLLKNSFFALFLTILKGRYADSFTNTSVNNEHSKVWRELNLFYTRRKQRGGHKKGREKREDEHKSSEKKHKKFHLFLVTVSSLENVLLD